MWNWRENESLLRTRSDDQPGAVSADQLLPRTKGRSFGHPLKNILLQEVTPDGGKAANFSRSNPDFR